MESLTLHVGPKPGLLEGTDSLHHPPPIFSRTGLTPGEGVAPPNLQDRKRVPPWRCACSVRAFWRNTYTYKAFMARPDTICGCVASAQTVVLVLREVHFGPVGIRRSDYVQSLGASPD